MPSQAIGKYRWVICGLLFFATTSNYLDRQVISLLKGTLETRFSWTETDYSNIVIAFQVAYAIGLFFAGRFIDNVGTKKGYAVSITAWSFAAAGHALATTTVGFGIARAFLGITEAGNFPAAIKTVAEWFPKKERAFATGIFNSGTNIGAIVAPLTVPLIAINWGWQWPFIFAGAIGLLWLICWLILYDTPSQQKRLSKTEYDYIHSDADEQKEIAEATDTSNVHWLRLLGFKQTWVLIAGKFLTDPVWWFYLFWLPAFLKAQYGLEGTQVSLPIALVYTMSAFGSVLGGWLPLYFIRKGWAVFKARKTAMFIYALFALPVVFAQLLGSLNMWLAIIIIGIATAGHQAWSANMYTTASDMFPKKAVGSLTGIAGMAGAVGGILIAKAAGSLFDYYKALNHIETGYYIMFFICGLAYLTAWLIMHLLVPKMSRVEV